MVAADPFVALILDETLLLQIFQVPRYGALGESRIFLDITDFASLTSRYVLENRKCFRGQFR